jgi:predicted RNA-binding Zn-ribbon protein involved in translation (DUF1610 family)
MLFYLEVWTMQEKQLKIALLVSVAVTALLMVGFVIESFTDSSGGGVIGSIRGGGIWMLCENPDCEAAYEVTQEEFNELLRSKGQILFGPGVMSRLTFVCRECGQETAYRGMQCQKCGALFIPEEGTGDYPDRCPECGYSATEEAIQKRTKK